MIPTYRFSLTKCVPLNLTEKGLNNNYAKSLSFSVNQMVRLFTGVANRSEIFGQAVIFLVTTGKQN